MANRTELLSVKHFDGNILGDSYRLKKDEFHHYCYYRYITILCQGIVGLYLIPYINRLKNIFSKNVHQLSFFYF